MHKYLLIFLFSLKIPWLLASIYTGTQNICSLSECSCISNVVECICTKNSTFQEYLQFRDDRRNLKELTLRNCDRVVFPPQSISAGTYLTSIHILNCSEVELKSESVSVSRLSVLNISSVQSLTFNQQTFKSFTEDSLTVSVVVEDVDSLVIKSSAFSRLKNLKLNNVRDLKLDPSALKMKVPTKEPTIMINMTSVSIKSLSSSSFASSFNKITIQNSVIDKIETNAFSGFMMTHVHLKEVEINRIDRGAFSDQSVIELLEFDGCKISSMAKKSIVAGISRLYFENSYVQSISKYGAINATVANVRIVNNTFRTLGQESFSLESWNSVTLSDNIIEFMEEGAINAIYNPIPSQGEAATFEFSRNEVNNANRHSLVTRIPDNVKVLIEDNKFKHHCDCNQEQYIHSLTGYSGLSSSFQDLSPDLLNTSLCRVPVPGQAACFPEQDFTAIPHYLALLCLVSGEEGPPPCLLVQTGQQEESNQGVSVYSLNQFYDDFLVLFQVNTTKGILLFLLFCVLSCVCILSICVGSVWIHRYYKRTKLMKSNKLSGSFQFNSQGEKAEILMYGSNHTSHSQQGDCVDDEPQYAEIAEVHQPPHSSTLLGESNGSILHEFSLRSRRNDSLKPGSGSNNSSDDMEATTMTDLTTLPKSGMTTLPSSGTTTLPSSLGGGNTLPLGGGETERLLGPRSMNNGVDSIGGRLGPALAESTPIMEKVKGRDSIRVSMSETSLTDEIMMALRDRLNDPTLYCTVMDAKMGAGENTVLAGEEDLYTAPIYNDPLTQNKS